MDKKIHLMTTSSLQQENGQIAPADALIWNELRDRGIAGKCFLPHDVAALFQNDTVKLHVEDTTLGQDALIVRSSRDAEERTYEITRAHEGNGALASDPAKSLVYPVGKLLPFIYRGGEVPAPKTCFFTTTNTPRRFVCQHVRFPFIVKPQKGREGVGVVLIHNEADFTAYIDSSIESSLIAQEYIADIADEFRVIVIGGKGLGVARKVSAALTKNAAQGGSFEKADDPDVVAFAERAAQHEQGDVYGTDVVRTTSGNLYLIENNRCPNFMAFREATGIKVEQKLVDFVVSKCIE